MYKNSRHGARSAFGLRLLHSFRSPFRVWACTKLESAVQQLFSYPANVISSSIFAFASTSVVEFPFTTSVPAFPFVRLHFLGDLLRAFGIFTDVVIILKISQPMRKISNANRVNQKMISRLLTLEFWLHTWKSGLFTGKQSTARRRGEICTCSMFCHTPIVIQKGDSSAVSSLVW